MQQSLLTWKRPEEPWTPSIPSHIVDSMPSENTSPTALPSSAPTRIATATTGILNGERPDGATCAAPTCAPVPTIPTPIPTKPNTTATATNLPPGFTPRAWQAEAVPLTVADLLDPGYTPGIWEVATGSGKSIGLCWLLWSLWQRGALPEQVVIVTSRTDLVADFCEVLRLFFPAEFIGRWDGHKKRRGRLLVTTYPSLPRVVAKLGAVGLLCCDEVHRSAARSVRATIEAIPLRFGMSATPFLGDKARRIVGFGRVLFTLTRAEAEAQGIIVPFEVVWLENPVVEGVT